MPLPTLIQTGFSTILDDIIISDTTGKKAISILQQHFTFTAYEITKAYQDSYGDAISAISVGLAAPDKNFAFAVLQKIIYSKVTREFANSIEFQYFQPFAQKRGIPREIWSALRKQLIKQLNQVAKLKDRLFQFQQITEDDLSALINRQGSPAITHLVLEQMQIIASVDETLAAFLSQDELLGKAMLFFFHDIIRKDERVEKTQAALQREGLAISAQKTHSAVKETQDLAEEILQLLRALMARQDLSSRVKPHDEFTRHNSDSLNLIRNAVAHLNQLPIQHPKYSQVSIIVGSALSSTGDLIQAENLFNKAIKNAQGTAEKALAHFDLFQVQLRRGAYAEALDNLQAAIAIEPRD